MPEAVEWDDRRSLSQVLEVISPLLGVRGDPEMVRIDRHHRALPLYHGNYYRRMKMVTDCLQQHSGLHLEANYRGGVSVRDRIACAYIAAKRIADELAISPRPSRMQVSSFPTVGPIQADTDMSMAN